jgi:hypothetical protein
LDVSPNYFPIASVQVMISDPQHRWPEIVMNFDPDKVPALIYWDRRFADETLAPSGEYRVMARACDTQGLCGSDTGVIEIPFLSTSTPTVLPSPSAVVTVTPQLIMTEIATQMSPTLVLMTPSPPEPLKPIQPAISLSVWQIVGIVTLFLAIASASVTDPRPPALDRLRESMRLIVDQQKHFPDAHQ